MRTADIIKDATGNVLRSKARTILTVSAIFIGAFTLTLTQSIGAGINSYIDHQLAGFASKDTLSISSVLDTGSDTFPAEYVAPEDQTGGVGEQGISLLNDEDIETISKIAGITKVEPLLVATPSYITTGDKKYEIVVNYTSSLVTPQLLKGTQLNQTLDAPYEIILPSAYLDALGYSVDKAVGETVQIGVRNFLAETSEVQAVIVGVQTNSLFGASISFNRTLTQHLADLETVGVPPAMQHLTTGYYALTAYYDADTITEAELLRIKTELEDAGYSATTLTDILGILKSVVDGLTAVLSAFAIIALIAAAFGIVNTLYMSVQERTREIGIMKAMGASRKTIFSLFSAEAIILGLLGSLVGLIGAIGVSYAANIATADLLKDLEGLTISLITTPNALAVIALIMVVAFIAGTLPASSAAKLDPIEALRYE